MVQNLNLGKIANIRRACVCAGLLASACLLVKPALADEITNGNFQTGTLAGWTVFTTSNGTNGVGLPSVVSFDTTGTGASDAAKFNVGEAHVNNTQQGGGLSQTISAPRSGIYTLSEDFASLDNTNGNVNSDAGTFSLLIDGVTVASRNLGGFASAHQILRGSFDQTVNLTAGSHTIEAEITRKFLANSTGSPTQYIDNISLISPIPEPSSFVLLGTGVTTLLFKVRRRRLLA